MVGILLACGQAEFPTDTNPPPPPVDSTAGIWVTSNLPTFTIDSAGIWNSDNSRGNTMVIGQSGPRHFRMKADGAMRVYYVSASNYISTIVNGAPNPGDELTIAALFVPTPPPPSTPVTTGLLRIVSSPSRMNVTLYASTMGADSLVANVVTDTTLVVEQGFYHAVCSDPFGVYNPVSAYAPLNPGENSIAVCMMPKVSNPPVLPSINFSVSPLTINFGDSVTITASGTNITGIFIAPLGVITLGGSFVDHPFATTTYCGIGFGPGGNTLPICHIVTVTPPGPSLRPDTTRLFFPDPTITVNDPRVLLWGLTQYFSGPYRDDIPVEIRVRVRYTTTKDESFAIRMQSPGPSGSDSLWAGYVLQPGTTNPVVADIQGASGWTWVTVGGFIWPNGSGFKSWAFHGSLFDIRNGIEGHLYDPSLPYGPVSFTGIEFIRWVPTP